MPIKFCHEYRITKVMNHHFDTDSTLPSYLSASLCTDISNSTHSLFWRNINEISFNTTVKWTALVACKVQLWVQGNITNNFGEPSVWQYTPLLPFTFSFALRIYQTPHTCWSISEKLLKNWKCNMKSFGEHSFSFVTPFVWNSMPASLQNIHTLFGFKTQYKTFLFKQAFSQTLVDHSCNKSGKKVGLILFSWVWLGTVLQMNS